jgi:hypothetical protein
MAEKRRGYINHLQEKIEVLEGQLMLVDYFNEHLLSYVQSSKFQGPSPEDRLVNVNDIIHRADLVRQALNGCLDMRDYQECFETEDGTVIA